MLAIRMRRLGAKKRPFYRVVVIDSHKARDGRALEVLGHYNPTTVPETFKLDRERFDHWLERGAQPSDTLRTLLTRRSLEGPEVDSGSAVNAVPATRPTPPSAAAPASANDGEVSVAVESDGADDPGQTGDEAREADEAKESTDS